MTPGSRTCTCCANGHHALDRRGVIRRAGLLAGSALALGATGMARASGSAEALLISCMDYRLADNVHGLMSALGMTDRYDHIVLAGASAGVVADQFADWHDTFWSHLEVAIQLHGIHTVMVVDHRDCGAYKIAFGEDHVHDRAAEMQVHAQVVGQMRDMVKERKPELGFEAYLMSLNGTAEVIPL